MAVPDTSAAKAALRCEELRIQVRQRLAQFRQFLFGAVHLNSRHVGYLQHLADQGADIFNMRQHALCALVTLEATGQVAVEAEAVKQAFRFGIGGIDEFNTHLLEGVSVQQVSSVAMAFLSLIMCLRNKM